MLPHRGVIYYSTPFPRIFNLFTLSFETVLTQCVSTLLSTGCGAPSRRTGPKNAKTCNPGISRNYRPSIRILADRFRASSFFFFGVP